MRTRRRGCSVLVYTMRDDANNTQISRMAILPPLQLALYPTPYTRLVNIPELPASHIRSWAHILHDKKSVCGCGYAG